MGMIRVSESFFQVSRLGLHENPLASDLTRLKFEFSAKWRRETPVIQWLTLDSFCCLLSSASVLIGYTVRDGQTVCVFDTHDTK